MTSIFRKHSRRFLVCAVAALTWQFCFPQHALAQVVATDTSTPPTKVVILPVGAAAAVAVPLAKSSTVVVAPVVIVAKVRTVVMTAYSSTNDQTDGDPYTTASGAKVQDGTIKT